MPTNNGVRKLAFRLTAPSPKRTSWIQELLDSARGMSTNLGVGAGTGAIGGVIAGPPAPYMFNEYGQPVSPGYYNTLANMLTNAAVGGAGGATLGAGYYGVNRALSRRMLPSDIRLRDELSTATPLPKYVLPTPKYVSPGTSPAQGKIPSAAPQLSQIRPGYSGPTSDSARAQVQVQTEDARQAVAKMQMELDKIRRSNPANFSQGSLPGVDNTLDPAAVASANRAAQYEEARAANERYLNKINEYRMQRSMRTLPGYESTPSDILVRNMTGIDPSNINDQRFRKMSALQEALIRDVEKTAAAKLRGIYAHKA